MRETCRGQSMRFLQKGARVPERPPEARRRSCRAPADCLLFAPALSFWPFGTRPPECRFVRTSTSSTARVHLPSFAEFVRRVEVPEILSTIVLRRRYARRCYIAAENSGIRRDRRPHFLREWNFRTFRSPAVAGSHPRLA